MTCKADASRTLRTPIRAQAARLGDPALLHPNAGDFFLPRDCSRSRGPPWGPRPSYPSTRKNGACWGPRPCPYGQLSSKARESSARLTAREALADHECVMSPAIFERERRSSRLFMRIRVLLAGKNQQGRRFRHACETIVVNAHGALLYFDQDLEIGSLLVLTNPFTQDEQECRVVYLGDDSAKGQRVAIEFLTPAPRFWGVEFTHPDWVPAQTSSLQKN